MRYFEKRARWWDRILKTEVKEGVYGPTYRLVRKDNPFDIIGSLKTEIGRRPETMSVSMTTAKQGYEGTGIGKYLYGKAIHDAKGRGLKVFASDVKGSTSPSAERVWKSLSKRHPVTRNNAEKGSRFIINL